MIIHSRRRRRDISKLICVLIFAFLLSNNSDKHASLFAQADDSAEGDADVVVEPPFPRLFYNSLEDAPIVPRRVKISSEVIGNDYKRTREEYLDLDIGRSAYIPETGTATGYSNKQQQQQQPQVILANAQTGQLFQYRPYTCKTSDMKDKSVEGIDFWSITVELSRPLSQTSKQLRVFGVAAMWLYAANNPKSYSRATMVYSASRDIYRLAHNWTVVDENSGVNLKFFFISSGFKKSELTNGATNMQLSKQMNNELQLELIQVESIKMRKIIRTINVLSIDYELDQTDYENILEVPIGYGCETKIKTNDGDDDKQDANIDSAMKEENEFWNNYLWTSSNVELEITATKIDKTDELVRRKTDTIYVQLAHLPMSSGLKDYDLMLTKIKSRERELKTITDHLLNVRYQIDLQRGSCNISHLSSSSNANNDNDLLVLKFSNGLTLSLERQHIELLFTSKGTFHFIKSQRRTDSTGRQVTRTYSEKTLPNWPLDANDDNSSSSSSSSSPISTGKMAREIRTFIIESQIDKSGGEAFSVRLESITLWVLDAASQSQLLEIYHLNVIDEERPLRSWPDVPRLFDVSQECYLDNPVMQSGVDFAWIELLYPLSSRQLDLLLENDFELKETIYEKMVSQYQLASVRIPRLELMFSDQGLVVRALLLDLPPMEILYDKYEGKVIKLDKNKGDMMFIASDLRHCTKLCQMYSCNTMSFCTGARSCLVGTGVIYNNGGETTTTNNRRVQQYDSNGACTTFSLPTEHEELIDTERLKRRLASLLSILSHQDYELGLDLPQMPDELALMRDESGVTSDADYKKFVQDYLLEVTNYLAAKGNRAPTLIISMILDDHFVLLMPSKFTIENNPLDDFAIEGKPEVDDQTGSSQRNDLLLFDSSKVVAFFHEGLSMSRYNYYKYQALVPGTGVGKTGDKLSLLNGLSYDQCALSCLESKCGTFSYCSSRKECVLASMATIGEAQSKRLLEDDADCFIAQRDFIKNFQQYLNVTQPEEYAAKITGGEVASVSDCALKCLHYSTGQPCMSFEYCNSKEGTGGDDHKSVQCFIQTLRQPEELFMSSSSNRTQLNESTSFNCDHYERSYLAEFNQVESRQLSDEIIGQLKTSEYTDNSLTPMDCADICLNQLNDCSAFQFCFDPQASGRLRLRNSAENNQEQVGGANYALSCLMIQSKPTNKQQQEELELLIGDEDNDADGKKSSNQLLKPSKYLEFNSQCQLFALRPDTLQAHLRDLAMGNTMTLEELRLAEQQAAQSALGGNIEMSWGRFIFLLFSVTLGSALAGLAICYARERNDFVREQIERARYLIGR